MPIPDVKATLQKLLSGNRRFGKIRAALPTNVASEINEPETENQSEIRPPYETTNDYRTAQLEAQAHIATLSPRHTRQRR